MYTKTFGVIFAGALTVATVAAQQNPPSQNPPSPSPPSVNPPSQPPRSPQPTPSERPATQTERSGAAAAVTVEGCLVREADVPGRKPNVAERAGVTDDHILVNTKMVSGTAPGGPFGLGGSPGASGANPAGNPPGAGDAGRTTPGATTPGATTPGATSPGAAGRTPGATASAGSGAGAASSGPMYEVEGLSGDQLKDHVNQRVQIEGRFENLDNARAGSAASQENLVELRASNIKKVGGSCSTSSTSPN